jgi:hypothetical protein
MERLRLHCYRTQPVAIHQESESLPLGMLGLLIAGLGVGLLVF